jgi:hypothetical protein
MRPRPESAQVDIIVRMFERHDQALSRRQLEHFGEAGESLRRGGALQQNETLTSLGCLSCGEDHPVELEFDQTSGKWHYYCGSVGWVHVDEADIINFSLRLDWLFDRLTEALRIGRPDRRCFIEGVLWQLGLARTGTTFWTAFAVRRVASHLDPILEKLEHAGAGYPGLVLTSSPEVPCRVRLPNQHRWLRLADLLMVSEGQLGAHEPVIRAALSGKGVRKLGPRKPGRPGVVDLVLKEFDRRRQAGVPLSGRGAEAMAVMAWLRTEHPEYGSRSKGRIENIIRERYAEWASRDPRSTK